MEHTIEKVDEDHWIVDGIIDVVYYNVFGKTGWYISKATGDTPARQDNFLNAIEDAMEESLTKKEVMTPPAGM